MIEAAAAAGAGERDALVLETLMAFKRAGCVGRADLSCARSRRGCSRADATSCAPRSSAGARRQRRSSPTPRRARAAWRLAFDHAQAFLDAARRRARPTGLGGRLRAAARTRIRRKPGAIRPRCSPMSAECVDRPGITTASPRFMGYIPGGGLFHSALGDFLAAASNKYSGFASAAPGAVRMENAVHALAGEGDRLSGGGRRHADLGRQHGQSHRDRRRARGARSRGRRRRLSHRASPIIASTRRCTSPAAPARRAG